jgi:hypothetical protein
MRLGGFGLAVVLAWSVGSSAWAACLPDRPAAKAFTTRGAPEGASRLLVTSGVLISTEAYGVRNLRRIKPVCDAATLQNGKTVYRVQGTSDSALPRIMPSNDRKAPLFFLMTVPDIADPSASSTRPAKPLGYVLASRGEKDALAFRAYDAIPPDVQLAADLGAALEGRIAPMLRVDLVTNKVQISLAEGAGEVAEPPASPAASR